MSHMKAWVAIVVVGSIAIANVMVVGPILLLTSVRRLDQEIFSWFCLPEKKAKPCQKHKKKLTCSVL